MAPLQDRLAAELTAARKAQDKPLTLLLGTILADTRNREIELKRDLTDDDVVDVLRKGVKKRRESMEAYEKAGRAELAATEAAEVAMLDRYLPASASEDDVRAAEREAIAAGAKGVGPVMGAVMPNVKGRADGGMINRVVREELGKSE